MKNEYKIQNTIEEFNAYLKDKGYRQVPDQMIARAREAVQRLGDQCGGFEREESEIMIQLLCCFALDEVDDALCELLKGSE